VVGVRVIETSMVCSPRVLNRSGDSIRATRSSRIVGMLVLPGSNHFLITPLSSKLLDDVLIRLNGRF
jgi:hypothetical protein